MASRNKMEHRLDDRKKLPIPVIICIQDQPSIRGVTKNVSRGGMFIEIDARVINLNCFKVQILSRYIFRINADRNNTFENNAINTPVYVIHRSNEGVGVIFWGATNHVEQELNWWMMTDENRRMADKKNDLYKRSATG